MARRPTISDLARVAGVGVATVDRALHGRANVSAGSLQRIAQAAVQLGYHAPQLAGRAQQAARPALRLGFVLHKPAQQFYRQFSRAIEQACAARHDLRITPMISYSPSQSPEDFAARIEAAAQECPVVAASAVNHPLLTRLVERLAVDGTSVVSVLNDFGSSAGAAYFGLDNFKVGRLAGWLMATMLHAGGRVAVFVGGSRWQGHALREAGFRSYLREHAPQVLVMDTQVNLETRQLTYEATLDLLVRHVDLRGIYVAGGGMEGAIAALREARPPGRVVLAVNELTDESRAGLADGYVQMAIATPLADLCLRLVDHMATMAQGPGQAQGQGRQVLLEPRIYLPESV